MKKVILFFGLMLGCEVGFSQIQNAHVMGLKDADTYLLIINKRIITVRLNHVDAPELKQAWGQKSKDSVSNLILDKNVEVELLKKDLYGRTLVNIKLNNKRLDSILIANGWAWNYSQYSSESMLIDLMSEAMQQKKGLWECGVKNVCPPSLFRQFNARNKMRFCKGCK